MTVGPSEKAHMGKQSRNLSTRQKVFDPAQVGATQRPGDTTSGTSVRYQQYGITMKLNQDKEESRQRGLP